MSARLNCKLIRFDRLSEWRSDHSCLGYVSVAVTGCFDILHVGHTRYLEEAHLIANSERPSLTEWVVKDGVSSAHILDPMGIVIAGINEDEAVRHLKGPSRPIHTSALRAEVLASMETVDYVCVFPGYTAEAFLRAMKPNIWVKGGEYTRDNLDPGEIDAVESNGGRIVFSTYHRGHSTTGILNQAL